MSNEEDKEMDAYFAALLIKAKNLPSYLKVSLNRKSDEI